MNISRPNALKHALVQTWQLHIPGDATGARAVARRAAGRSWPDAVGSSHADRDTHCQGAGAPAEALRGASRRKAGERDGGDAFFSHRCQY